MLQPVGVRQPQRRGTGTAIMPVLRRRRMVRHFLPVGENRRGAGSNGIRHRRIRRRTDL